MINSGSTYQLNSIWIWITNCNHQRHEEIESVSENFYSTAEDQQTNTSPACAVCPQKCKYKYMLPGSTEKGGFIWMPAMLKGSIKCLLPEDSHGVFMADGGFCSSIRGMLLPFSILLNLVRFWARRPR